MRVLNGAALAPAKRLLNEPQTRWQRWLLLGVVIMVFISLPLYQTLRQPSLGDSDMLRIGLLVLNRYQADAFPGDIAMQGAVWWPGYTPLYLAVAGFFTQLTGDFETGLTVLFVPVYVLLLTGFYALGRRLGLAYFAALAWMMLAGMYVTMAHALAWGGVKLEMVAPRNIYLALLPWLLWLGLHLHDQRDRPGAVWRWAGYGAALGLLTNLHPITGTVLLVVIGLLLLAAVIVRLYPLRLLLVYGVAAVPGVALARMLTQEQIAPALEAPAAGVSRAAREVYDSVARANIFAYRLPDWDAALALYTAITLITLAGLLWLGWSQRRLARRWWLVFGAAQFYGALLLMMADWLVLLAGGLWLLRAWSADDDRRDHLALAFLAAVNLAALTISPYLNLLNVAGILNDSFVFALQRMFQRGGRLVYGPLALLLVLGAAYILARWRERGLLLAAIASTLVIGWHEPVFETLPGRWLPLPGWAYLGVAVVLIWPLLDRWPPLRFGLVAVLILQAVTHVLTVPASAILTLLVGLLAGVIYGVWGGRPGWRPLTLLAGGLVLLALVLLPVNGVSLAGTTADNLIATLRRNWSRTEWSSPNLKYHVLGRWIIEHTPPGSIIITDQTDLRLWALRPQIGGALDAYFIRDNPEFRARLRSLADELRTAHESAAGLLAFAEQYNGDYILLPADDNTLANHPAVTPVYEDRAFRLYAWRE